MKRMVISLAVAATAVMPVAAPAQAATTRDLYMVKDVQQLDGGIYVGDFVSLRKTGKRVVGTVGAFSSEYVCVRGKVKDGKLRGTYYDRGMVSGHFTRTWVGHGKRQHIKGMTPVSWAQARTYLGSNPTRFIDDCIGETS